MLTADKLTCVRSDQLLFSNLNFNLMSQEILHIRGINGSGKSSLLQILAGLASPQQGQVGWCGTPLAQIQQAYQRQLLYLGHKTGVKAQLTVLENLAFAASLSQARPKMSLLLAALTQLDLLPYQDTLCHRLSAGQRQRVALARLLILPAKLWLLDEPFTALDTGSIALMEKLMFEHLRAEGMIVLTSHQPFSLGQMMIKQLNL